MLGYEPPRPKLWKAVLGAGIVTFPLFYIADVSITRHRPRWVYLALATCVSVFLGLRMYRNGPDGLRPVPMGVPLWKIFGVSSWQPPQRHDTHESD